MDDVFTAAGGGGTSLPLIPPSYGGTSGDMEPWQSSVESRLGQLHGDIASLSSKVDSNFRWLLGAYGTGVILILGALAGGFLSCGQGLLTAAH